MAWDNIAGSVGKKKERKWMDPSQYESHGYDPNQMVIRYQPESEGSYDSRVQGIFDKFRKGQKKREESRQTPGMKQLRDFAQKEQETGQQGYKPLKKNKRPDSKVEPGRLQAIKQFFSRFTSSR